MIPKASEIADTTGRSCVDYESTGGGENDATVCMESTLSPDNYSTVISWDITYSANHDGDTVVECTVRDSPDTGELSTQLMESPVTINSLEETTDFTVACEAADDNDGPASNSSNYDDMTQTKTVEVINDAPNASDDNSSAEVGESISINVLDNDDDPNDDTIRISDVGDPDNGTAWHLPGTDGLVNPEINYTPSYAGTATFDYTIKDEHGATDSATVTVTVSDMAASDDYTDEATWCGSGIPDPTGTPIDIDVLANDTGDNLSITDVTEPTDDSGLNGDTSIVTKSGTDHIRYVAGVRAQLYSPGWVSSIPHPCSAWTASV